MVEALWVTIYGMGLVFVALCLVMLCTIAVEREFRDREPQPAVHPTTAQPESEDLELVAALTAAVLAWEGRSLSERAIAVPPAGVVSLSEPSLGWKASGRIRTRR